MPRATSTTRPSDAPGLLALRGREALFFAYEALMIPKNRTDLYLSTYRSLLALRRTAITKEIKAQLASAIADLSVAFISEHTRPGRSWEEAHDAPVTEAIVLPQESKGVPANA